MRFFIIFAIVLSMIYYSDGQYSSSFSNPSINPFVNPSFSNRPNYPYSNQAYPNQQQQPSGNPLSRVLGWFGRTKKQNRQLETLNDSTPFSNSIPKGSTDQMISDAIADQILQESKEHQKVVGSPFIEDVSRTDTMVDHQSSASETSEQVDRESYGKSVANAPTDTIPITEALRIVSASNLTDCVARVICELSCNANAYGPPGRTVFRNMIKLQFDQSITGDDAKFFRQAASKGRQIIQGKRDCIECFTIFPSCKATSKDLVAVSSMFKL